MTFCNHHHLQVTTNSIIRKFANCRYQVFKWNFLIDTMSKLDQRTNYFLIAWRKIPDGEKDAHTTFVMTSKELSSCGSLGFVFKSCTTYSVRTYKYKELKIAWVFISSSHQIQKLSSNGSLGFSIKKSLPLFFFHGIDVISGRPA